jgi:predicted NUDIX family NTP pyrophosphohydrolase
MARLVSAGVLAWRRTATGPQVLLVHPGGPFWARKDLAAWSIPKGLVEEGEDNLAAAIREFAEEIGQPIAGPFEELAPCRTPGGKWVHAWLAEADLDLADIRSNLVQMEWPKGSGRMLSFPEVDRAAYFSADEARPRIHKGQQPILDEALARIG